MKLIIQIPCFNEERTLPSVLRDFPSHIEGIDLIETQIIDDGSMDNTVGIAQEYGVDYIIRFPHNRGLAAAFQAGIENAISHNADILVNTDGDNQYNGADIVKLVRTMMEERADLVIGCRPIKDHPEFSLVKRGLQLLGSWVVRRVSKTKIPDATSGFRAYSRQALLQLNIISTFSYCLETIIQAGLANMKVTHASIRVNPKTRPSRLFSNMADYIYRQVKTIVQMYILYRANSIFRTLAMTLFMSSAALAGRYTYKVMVTGGVASDFWPSIILSAALFMLAGFTYLTGLLASLLAAQRKISEEAVYHLRCLNLTGQKSVEKTTPVRAHPLRTGTLLQCLRPKEAVALTQAAEMLLPLRNGTE